MTESPALASIDRTAERCRAVALAHHYRESEGLSMRQIADRLGRSPATIKAYFYDPTGEKARAVKARYVGVCRGCGAYTQPRNGKGDAYAYCKACHPGAAERKWTRELLISAMVEWRERYGRLPSSYDWSRTHARRRGGRALRRLADGHWPAASEVGAVFGTWAAARQAAAENSPGSQAAYEQPDHLSARGTSSIVGAAYATGYRASTAVPEPQASHAERAKKDGHNAGVVPSRGG